jgi:hypothetical protein
MRSVRAALLAAGLLSGAAGVGQAADFKAVDLPDGGGPGILISGVIRPGDETAFHAVAAKMSSATVITTGPGGAVGAALNIGTETRNRGWSTLVPADTSCASACSMIWLAGTQRMLGANARIGFHAMALIQQGQRTETHDLDYLLREWLNSLGYSLDATATIVNTHAASIRWYDTIELNANAIPTENYP